MHPSDERRHGRRRQQHEHASSSSSSGDERKGLSPQSAWKQCTHAEQHHALLRLPASIHSIHYDSQKANTCHSREPSISATVPPAQVFGGDHRHNNNDDLGYSTVFAANPFGQDRGQRFPHHHDQHNRNSDSPLVQAYPVVANATHEPMRSMPPRTSKGSLSFILDNNDESEEKQDAVPMVSRLSLDDKYARNDNDDDSSDYSLDRYTAKSWSGSERQASPPSARGSATALQRKTSIKKSRICKVEQCTRYVVNKGLCIGHGGGKRCAVAGCTSSAKNMGVCWKHGGSTKCTIEGCDNRAKSRGVCWSHGGGRKCKEETCTKTAVSNGLCWAHGGGKRCIVDSCKKPAYERNGNLCATHQASHVQSA